MITIDGFEIRATWTLEPLYENFNNALMKYPAVKDRVTEDFEEKKSSDSEEKEKEKKEA